MPSLDLEVETSPKFFMNLSQSAPVHPELTPSWSRATDMLDRFPLAFSFRQQLELNCTLPLKMTVRTHPFQKGKSSEYDPCNSQSSLYLDWFQLPIKCTLKEQKVLLIGEFGPFGTARKILLYAIYPHIFTHCCDKPASMFWLKLINNI